MQKSIEKTMYLGIDFLKDFDGFSKEKWRHVGTNIEKKSMPTSKNDFLTKLSFTLGKTMILKVQGHEVGGKNQWKIDKKMESRWEGILASNFNGFWQDRSKKESKKRWKNGRHQDGHKIGKRRSDTFLGAGSEALGRGKPLPEGRGEGVWEQYSTLNHLSPVGLWD